VFFAEHCPCLYSLTIVLDATRVPKSYQPHEQRVRQWRLFDLVVEDSPIKDPLPVAAFLSDIFPGLTEVVPKPLNSVELDERQKSWNEVHKLVPAFASVRASERRYLNMPDAGDDDEDDVSD